MKAKKVEAKSNLRLFQSQKRQTLHLISTVEFNWFKRRTSHALNSRVKFGTCEIRRLNLLKLRNYKTQVKELGRNDGLFGHISEMEITICGRQSSFTGTILVMGDM